MSAVEFDRPAFVSMLDRLALTAGDARTFPILGCVAITGGAAMTSALDTFTRTTLGSNGLGVAVDCRRLLGIVKSMNGATVGFEQRGQDVVVSGDRATFRLSGSDVTLFPACPAIPTLTALRHDDLADVVALAGRLDTERFGVLVAHAAGQFGLAATDGYRLVIHGGITEGSRVVIHGSGLRALARLDVTGVGHSDDWLFFGSDEALVGVRRKDGTYPDIGAAIRAAYAQDGVAHVDGRRFRDALARVLLMEDGTNRVAITIGDGKLTLSARNVDAGDAVDSLPCEHSGKLKAAYNGRHLQDWARAADGDTALRYDNGTTPLHCTTSGLEGTQYVLMPMR